MYQWSTGDGEGGEDTLCEPAVTDTHHYILVPAQGMLTAKHEP